MPLSKTPKKVIVILGYFLLFLVTLFLNLNKSPLYLAPLAVKSPPPLPSNVLGKNKPSEGIIEDLWYLVL